MENYQKIPETESNTVPTIPMSTANQYQNEAGEIETHLQIPRRNPRRNKKNITRYGFDEFY